MMDTDALQAPGQRGAGHALWLAMQSAYGEYRDASAALDPLDSQPSQGVSSPEDLRRLVEALRGQRVAFERYVESRMQFSEFLRDRRELEVQASDPGPAPPAVAVTRSATYALAIALLGATSFLLAREWRHVRDLETAHDEVRAMLNQTRSAIQALERKLDRGNPELQLAAQQPPGAPATTGTGSPVPSARPKAAVQRLVPRPQHALRKQPPKKRDRPGKTAAMSHDSNPQVSLQRPGNPIYYAFTLTSSRDFQRVGPVRLSLRAVNRDRHSFDLSVTWDRFQLDKKNVQLREPLSIRLAGRQAPLELVVTRIERDRVQGYLKELRPNQPEHAANDVRRRMADSP
jgi:hypothetical protein